MLNPLQMPSSTAQSNPLVFKYHICIDWPFDYSDALRMVEPVCLRKPLGHTKKYDGPIYIMLPGLKDNDKLQRKPTAYTVNISPSFINHKLIGTSPSQPYALHPIYTVRVTHEQTAATLLQVYCREWFSCTATEVDTTVFVFHTRKSRYNGIIQYPYVCSLPPHTVGVVFTYVCIMDVGHGCLCISHL